MRRTFLTSLRLLAAVSTIAWVAACNRPAATDADKSADAGKGTVPRTAWGDPDLRAVGRISSVPPSNGPRSSARRSS
jgi:hypothetical protein